MKMVAQQSANWDQAEALAKTQTILQGQEPQHQGHHRRQRRDGPRSEGGAATAAGRTDVIVVGFDGSPDAIAAIKARRAATRPALQPAALMLAAGGPAGGRLHHRRRDR